LLLEADSAQILTISSSERIGGKDSISALTRFDGDPSVLDYLDQQTAALPYHLLDRPRTLVLGAGGGADVLLALHHGAAAVDAVELNPQLVELVRDTHAEFTGRVYGRDDVTVHVGEARAFVEASAQRWDLIQVALLDSFTAAASGVMAFSESPLYTVEALRAYRRHLAPGGILAITRWLRAPPRGSLKLVATAIAALEADRPPGIYNVGDGDTRSSTWFAMEVARQAGLPPPPTVTRKQAEETFSARRLSFLRESRRLDLTRMLEQLRPDLKYTDATDGIAASLGDPPKEN